MKSSHLLTSLIVLLCLQAFPVIAAEETARIDQIYAEESATATPDFRRDIVPLLGKVGCNGRACHGSFQGQGGFRLSLFGYDFKADHENLTQGEKPRVNAEVVAESVILKKALEQVDHEGGKRFADGSWQNRVLRRWLKCANDNLFECIASPSPPWGESGRPPTGAKATSVFSAPVAANCGPPSTRATTWPTTSAASKTSTTSTF